MRDTLFLMNDIFDVLADPIRREILARLRTVAPGDLSVGDLVTALAVTQPTVSKQLKVLRDVGLVAVREEGQHRFYRLNPAPLEAVDGWLSYIGDAAEAPQRKSRTTHDAPREISGVLADVDFARAGRLVGKSAARVEVEVRSVVEAVRTILGSNPR